MYVRATLRGDLRETMRGEVRAVATGLRRAVASAGKTVQDELRADVRAAGFAGGGRSLANAWRLRVYPRPGVGLDTFRPAAQITTSAAVIIDAFDRGQDITARGGRYLAFPTGYNAIRGRRGAGRRGGVRFTPAQMRASRDAFVIPTKRAGVKLWCLRIREGRGLSRRSRNRVLAFAAGQQVLTGRRKGQQAGVKAALERGFVPMWILAKRVRPGKRLNLDTISRRASDHLARAVISELERR